MAAASALAVGIGGGGGTAGAGGAALQAVKHPLSGANKQVHITALIDGVKTELLLSAYADRIVVVCTQIGKIAQLLTGSVDGVSAESAALQEPSYSVHTLLGKRDDLHASLLARQLIADISKSSPKPLLLALGLAPVPAGKGDAYRFAALRTIMALIKQHRVW